MLSADLSLAPTKYCVSVLDFLALFLTGELGLDVARIKSSIGMHYGGRSRVVSLVCRFVAGGFYCVSAFVSFLVAVFG